MSVKTIKLIQEINPYADKANDYDEPYQGTTYNLVRIYEVTNDDGSVQYFKHETVLGSYGYAYAEDIAAKFTEVKPQEKTVTVFV